MTSLRADLLSRYGTAPVPRYTSYPSANLWPARDESFARDVLGRAGRRPVSLYVHVPFCRKLCFYCGCNMMVTHDDALVERYLKALDAELGLVAGQLAEPPEVVQLHLGGGTPTFLNEAQLERLMHGVRRAFPAFRDDAEVSIEVHPSVTTRSQLEVLARLGFSRVSMGVQDFDPEVQAKVNRPQPFEVTRDLIVAARALGFISVNVDLMYGLPLQTVPRFNATLDLVDELNPERIALFGYAHMPRLKKHQRLILVDDLPGPEVRLALLERAIERLLGSGYVYVGLDHFARADDELVRARQDGSLRRNFMGYTTCADSDVLAFGPSSISEVQGAFLQSEREVRDWASRVEGGHLPTVRGHQPSADDDVRRDVIQHLFCQLGLDTRAFGEARGFRFEDRFAPELERLSTLERDGLVVTTPGHVRITPQGQLLLRNVAAVFDAYLDDKTGGPPRAHSTAV